MLTVTLSSETEARLNKLSSQTRKDTRFYVERAVEEFLDEHEDLIRILDIQEGMDKGEIKIHSLEEVKRMYHEKNSQALDC